jgi:hypothetical protein
MIPFVDAVVISVVAIVSVKSTFCVKIIVTGIMMPSINIIAAILPIMIHIRFFLSLGIHLE